MVPTFRCYQWSSPTHGISHIHRVKISLLKHSSMLPVANFTSQHSKSKVLQEIKNRNKAENVQQGKDSIKEVQPTVSIYQSSLIFSRLLLLKTPLFSCAGTIAYGLINQPTASRQQILNPHYRCSWTVLVCMEYHTGSNCIVLPLQCQLHILSTALSFSGSNTPMR